MIPIDLKYLQIRAVLANRGQYFLAHIIKERRTLFESHLPSAATKNIPSTETDSFLLHYGSILAAKIRSLMAHIDGYDALFILCRIPWMKDWRNKTWNSVVNRRRLVITIAMNTAKPVDNDNGFIQGPPISEETLLSALQLEDCCAELHYTQSVYRSIQKARFIGVAAGVEVREGKFRSSSSAEVHNSIKVYENRCGEAFPTESRDVRVPEIDSFHYGLEVRAYPQQDKQQPTICPNEEEIPFLPVPLGRKGSYLCIPLDVTRRLKQIRENCELAGLTSAQTKALLSLLCIAALRQQLLDIRCTYVAKRNYRYDLESKGYIVIEHPLASAGFQQKVRGLIRDLNLESVAPDPNIVIREWLNRVVAKSTVFPAGIQFDLDVILGVARSDRWMLCYPEHLNLLEYQAEQELNSGGEPGTYYGNVFEKWAVSFLRHEGRLTAGITEWLVQQKVYRVADNKQWIAEIDYSCYRNDLLFLIDMKISSKLAALEKSDARKNWIKLKRMLDDIDQRAKTLISHWTELNPAVPASVKYIVPIVCTSEPLFMKISSEYVLWRQGEKIIPRACMIDELVDVLTVFDFDQYKSDNGYFLTVQ